MDCDSTKGHRRQAPPQQEQEEDEKRRPATALQHACPPHSCTRVQSLAGVTLAEVSPVPETIALLKEQVCAICCLQPGLVRLVQGDRIFGDGDSLPDGDLTLLVDESALFTWDLDGNPHKNSLERQATSEGSAVTFVDAQFDYVNVLSVQPVTQGVHYFEFVMHVIGDEQWCGVTNSHARAGYPGNLEGCFYYCGRRYDDWGALHAPRERSRLLRFKKVENGDVISVLVDFNHGALVFLLNGEMQGGCVLPTAAPLYLTTCLDVKDDRVELRKPPLASVPAAVLTFAASNDLARIPTSPEVKLGGW